VLVAKAFKQQTAGFVSRPTANRKDVDDQVRELQTGVGTPPRALRCVRDISRIRRALRRETRKSLRNEFIATRSPRTVDRDLGKSRRRLPQPARFVLGACSFECGSALLPRAKRHRDSRRDCPFYGPRFFHGCVFYQQILAAWYPQALLRRSIHFDWEQRQRRIRAAIYRQVDCAFSGVTQPSGIAALVAGPAKNHGCPDRVGVVIAVR